MLAALRVGRPPASPRKRMTFLARSRAQTALAARHKTRTSRVRIIWDNRNLFPQAASTPATPQHRGRGPRTDTGDRGRGTRGEWPAEGTINTRMGSGHGGLFTSFGVQGGGFGIGSGFVWYCGAKQ